MGNNGEDYTGEIEFKSPQGRVLHADLWQNFKRRLRLIKLYSVNRT